MTSKQRAKSEMIRKQAYETKIRELYNSMYDELMMNFSSDTIKNACNTFMSAMDNAGQTLRDNGENMNQHIGGGYRCESIVYIQSVIDNIEGILSVGEKDNGAEYFLSKGIQY